MKLIFHHLLKDVRAQRWLLLLWALVLVIPLILNALVFQPDYDSAKYIETLRVSPLLVFIYVIVWTILVARLIQSDPVTGSTSFWLTRPIPTWVYVPSKLIFLIFLVCVPGALSIIASDLQFGSTGEMVRDHLGVFFIAQIIGGIGVVWLATYTPGLLHFAGTLCVGLLGLFLLVLLDATLVHPHAANGAQSLTADNLSDILVPGLVVSLIVQHWRRQGRAGFITGIAAIVLAVTAQLFLPPRVTPGIAKVSPVGKALAIDVSPDWQKHIFWSRRDNPSEAMADLKPVDSQNAAFVVESATGEFQAPGSAPVPLAILPEFPFMPLTIRMQWQFKRVALAQAALPDDTISLPDNRQEGGSTITLFSLDPAQKIQLAGKTGSLNLSLHGQKLTLVQVAQIPLDQPHSIARTPGGFIRINVSAPSDDTRLVVWKVAMEKNVLWSQEKIYVLVDPRSHTGTILDSTGSSSSSNTIGGTFRTIDSETTLSVEGNETLDQKVLYVYDVAPTTPIEIALTAPDFTMNPK